VKRGLRDGDLPRLSGVSKEAISMAMGFLQARGYALVEPETLPHYPMILHRGAYPDGS
jgi:hypothetical protein